jgi:dihydrodipicolinate synthase/N-acetylneuraminate lyase
VSAAALRAGLSVPLVTPLLKGRLDARSMQRLCAHVEAGGRGADVVFPAGTTGEWNRLPAPLLRRATEACAAAFRAGKDRPAVWAGVTHASLAETLQSLRHAARLGLPAVVLAPLSIADAPPPLELLTGRVLPALRGLRQAPAVCLYDNADIAARQGEDHLRTRDVKAMAALPGVLGVKVSAPMDVLGHYMKAARHFKSAHEFGVYIGNANLCFKVFAPATGYGWLGRFRAAWQAWVLAGQRPCGVVAGPANLFPRAWKEAWTACLLGDAPRMLAYQRALERLSDAWRFEESGKKKSKAVACLKLALAEEGVLRSPELAPGTAALDAAQARSWLKAYAGVKSALAQL